MKRTLAVVALGAVALAIVVAQDAPKAKRINKAIELLEQGQPI